MEKDIRKKKLSHVSTCHGFVLRSGESPLLCVVRFNSSCYSVFDILRGAAWDECNLWGRLRPTGWASFWVWKQSPFETKKYQTNRGSERDWYNAERYFKDRESCIEVSYERKWKRATVLAIRRFMYLEWCSLYFYVEKTKQNKWSKLS